MKCSGQHPNDYYLDRGCALPCGHDGPHQRVSGERWYEDAEQSKFAQLVTATQASLSAMGASGA